MKTLLIGLVLGLSGMSGVASAACGGANNPQLTQSALSTLLQGKTLCAKSGSDRWQEEHLGGPNSGPLWDYKLGPNHAVDPREQVGSWSVSGGSSGQLTHAYTGGGSYTYQVYDNLNGTYDLCGSATVTNATVRAAPPCPN